MSSAPCSGGDRGDAAGSVNTGHTCSGLMTVEQVAERVGVAVATIRGHIARGNLTAAHDSESGVGRRASGRGKRAYYAATDVERLMSEHSAEAYNARRAERREAILSAAVKVCTGPCGRSLPFDAFDPHPLGVAGRKSRCRDCGCAASAQYNRDHSEERSAYKKRWRRTNRTHVRAYKREWQRRQTRERGGPYRRIRRYQNAYQREYYRLFVRADVAVQDGKTSPICRRYGFSIVRSGGDAGRYRAARLDKPLPQGERAIAHFERMAGRWVCLAPPLSPATTADARLLRWLMDQSKRKARACR